MIGTMEKQLSEFIDRWFQNKITDGNRTQNSSSTSPTVVINTPEEVFIPDEHIRLFYNSENKGRLEKVVTGSSIISLVEIKNRLEKVFTETLQGKTETALTYDDLNRLTDVIIKQVVEIDDSPLEDV